MFKIQIIVLMKWYWLLPLIIYRNCSYNIHDLYRWWHLQAKIKHSYDMTKMKFSKKPFIMFPIDIKQEKPATPALCRFWISKQQQVFCIEKFQINPNIDYHPKEVQPIKTTPKTTQVVKHKSLHDQKRKVFLLLIQAKEIFSSHIWGSCVSPEKCQHYIDNWNW